MHYLYPNTWLEVAANLQSAGGSILFWAIFILGLFVTGVVFHVTNGNYNDAPIIIVGAIISFIVALGWPVGVWLLCAALWCGVFMMIILLPDFVMRRIARRYNRIQENIDKQ